MNRVKKGGSGTSSWSSPTRWARGAGWYWIGSMRPQSLVRSQGLPSSSPNPKGCLRQVLRRVHQATFCCHLQEREGPGGDFSQERAHNAPSFHLSVLKQDLSVSGNPTPTVPGRGPPMGTHCVLLSSCHSISDVNWTWTPADPPYCHSLLSCSSPDP